MSRPAQTPPPAPPSPWSGKFVRLTFALWLAWMLLLAWMVLRG